MIKRYLNKIFLIFILALPFSWANMGSMSIYRLVTMLTFAIWIIVNRFKIPIPNDTRKKYFFSWIAYVGYSVFVTTFIPSNANITFGMLLLIIISLIFFSSRINSNFEKYIDLMWLSATIFFILLFIFGSRGLVGEWGTRERIVILGTATDANEFSSFFIVALPIALFHLIKDKNVIKKCLCGLLLISGIYVVLMAGSRAALLAVIMALIITIFTIQKPSVHLVMVIVLLSLLFIIIIPKYILPMIPKQTLARLSLEALQQDKGSGRSDIWKAAINLFMEGNPINLLIGYGYGNLKVQSPTGLTSTMHNQYIQQLISYGVIGFILYIRMIILAYHLLQRNCRRYVGAYIGLLFMAMTISMGPSYKILWILLFMIGIKRNTKGEDINDSYFNDSRYRRR